MEERLRQMESDMNTKSGTELDELLSTYTRLSHTFELETDTRTAVKSSVF